MDVLVAQLISARGFQAQTTLEAGNLGCSDAERLLLMLNHITAYEMQNQLRYL